MNGSGKIVAVLKEFNLRKTFWNETCKLRTKFKWRKPATDLVVNWPGSKMYLYSKIQESAKEATFLVAKWIAQYGKPFAEGVCDVMCSEAKHKIEN